jgi:amphi-Trp domain-containing protein
MKHAREKAKPEAAERPSKSTVKQRKPKPASRLIEVEGATPLPRVIETLEALVAALRSGSVEVRHGEESIVLGPREVLGLELSARSKGKRQRLTLELKWRKYGTADADLDLSVRPGPAPALVRAISDYAAAASASAGEDSEASEVAAPAYTATGEAHEAPAAEDAAEAGAPADPEKA